jgi:hypothetical protein
VKATDLKGSGQQTAPDADQEFLLVFDSLLQDVKGFEGSDELPEELGDWARHYRRAAETRGYHKRAYAMTKALMAAEAS